MRFYTPSQTAEETGFSLDTLRYYERIGLVYCIDRTAGGRRRYSETDLQWLRMLRCLRDTGMPIAEMVRFTELTRDGSDTVPQRLALLEEHDERIEREIAGLRERQAHIRRKISTYRALADERQP
ncbi:MerR family transcriptional regulator [Streptomyces litchfieldiae]|uniref:MerR family transcriptional regulator n=1 Tax=Streptomyces litchfieldiae TaxID=3075543 RepID=A0ABU2MWR4_9ACTN|nr:MerR family transcriptional regulator [Streptomyces sp. DSM 44938]MDT0345955.1 MerR family transcriptional regulator [Streptomyces sp. DSM 44938]